MITNIKVATFFCVYLFLVSAPSFAQTKDRLIFPSVSDLRKEFSGILFRSATKAKGTVIYLHGGGCIPTVSRSNYEDWTTNMLSEAGWAVLVLDYDDKLGGDTDWAAGGIDDLSIDRPVHKDRCDKNTEDLIRDISAAVLSYSESTGEQNIFVMGHSFGAYLINLLATQDLKIKGVQGYISLHGLWNTRNLGLKINRTVPANPNPIDRSPEKLSNILIVHTVDDTSAPVSQVDDFKRWIGSRKKGYQVKVYSGGGHEPGPFGQRAGSTTRWYPYRDFQRTVLNFMNRRLWILRCGLKPG